MQPAVSILIATQGRAPQLQRLLDSLVRLENHQEIPHEILVGNNAQGQASATVEALLQTYRARQPERWLHVREPIPGKSRALNRLVPLAKANVLAFLRRHAGLDSHTAVDAKRPRVSSAAQSLSDDLLLQQTRS